MKNTKEVKKASRYDYDLEEGKTRYFLGPISREKAWDDGQGGEISGEEFEWRCHSWKLNDDGGHCVYLGLFGEEATKDDIREIILTRFSEDEINLRGIYSYDELPREEQQYYNDEKKRILQGLDATFKSKYFTRSYSKREYYDSAKWTRGDDFHETRMHIGSRSEGVYYIQFNWRAVSPIIEAYSLIKAYSLREAKQIIAKAILEA